MVSKSIGSRLVDGGRAVVAHTDLVVAQHDGDALRLTLFQDRAKLGEISAHLILADRA